jgi:DNA-binding NtrC family response regulator
MRYILVATENQKEYEVIVACFRADYDVELAHNYDSSFDMFRLKRYEFFFLDIDLIQSLKREDNYKTVLQSLWRFYPTAQIIILCRQELIREAVKVVKAGASDYLAYPLDISEVKLITDNIIKNVRLQSELDYHRNLSWQSESLANLRTKNDLMKDVFKKVHSVAQTDSTVLLTGETGTGKGLIANLIHQHSQRRANQFISIHTGAITETLLESELFGHEKGSFTGAIRRKIGKFEIAHNGTIFLDEIGTIPKATQIKLLQVLQNRTFQRVGGEADIEVNVRIISATNEDLRRMCEEGAFRRDLYYRLNVFPIELPPLRKRIEDIPLLVEEFMEKASRLGNKEIRDVDAEVIKALRSYSWPGNIRELENLLERAWILETSPILSRDSFPGDLFADMGEKHIALIDTGSTLEAIRKREIARIERKYLIELLIEYGGRLSKVAQAAGIGPRQLHKLMRKYELRKEDYKHL